MHYTLIGYVTKDIVPEGFRWGGTVSYSGRVAAQLGVKVSILTSMEPDPSILQLDPRLHWHIHPSPQTTTFVNEYDQRGNRRQQLLARAEEVPLDALKSLNPPPDIIHIAPLANDGDPLAIRQFIGELHGAWLVATPQGWMRRVDEQHQVHRVEWQNAEAVLPYLKAVVFSDEDVDDKEHLAEVYAQYCPTVLYTRGAKGSILYHNGEQFMINAAPANVVDPTGAGDVIGASFFIYYRETGDPVQAAIFGTVAASISIEGVGTSTLPTRAEIEERLAQWDVTERIAR